jgi:hypothetical protein
VTFLEFTNFDKPRNHERSVPIIFFESIGWLVRPAGNSEEITVTRKSPTSSITLEESIDDFLLRRLREVGLVHVFGVAGDFNLEILEQMESADGPKWLSTRFHTGSKQHPVR